VSAEEEVHGSRGHPEDTPLPPPPSRPVPRRPWPRWKIWLLRIGIGAGALLVVGTVAYLTLRTIARNRLEEELAELGKGGETLDVSAHLLPAPEDDRNAAPLLKETFQALVGATVGEEDVLARLEENPSSVSGEGLRLLAGWVARNATTIEALGRAAERPRCDFGLDYSDPFAIPLDHIRHTTGLLDLVTARCHCLAREGRGTEALAFWRGQRRLWGMLLEDPLLISHVVVASIDATLLTVLEELLRRCRPGPEELSRVLRTLGGVDFTGHLGRAMRVERCIGWSVFQRLLEDPAVAGQALNVSAPGSGGIFPAWFSGPLVRLDAAYFLATMKQLIALTDQPYHKAREELEALRSECEERPWYSIFTALFMPMHVSLLERSAAHRAAVQTARAGVAVIHHFRVQGTLPRSLDDLAWEEDWGPVPCDPVTGGPLRFDRGEAGQFRVWSVGLDGCDDGGRELEDSTDRGGDIVLTFTVREKAGE
jgi:hypothetical protein